MANTILKTASSNGINSFDTAPTYGDSEKIIGDFLATCSDMAEPPVVTTKLSPISVGKKAGFDSIYSGVKRRVTRSMTNLGISKIPLYLLHRASIMHHYDGLVLESCLKLKQQGLIGLLGVSVYSPQEVESALDTGIIEAIEVPLNIFDHRLIHSGLLKELKKKGLVIFARSVYLQGLFFLDEGKLPASLSVACKPLKQLHQLASECKINTAEMALKFVRDLGGVTSLIIGAETSEQLINDIEIMDSPALSPDIRNEILSLFSDMPLDLINPSLWRL